MTDYYGYFFSILDDMVYEGVSEIEATTDDEAITEAHKTANEYNENVVWIKRDDKSDKHPIIYRNDELETELSSTLEDVNIG